MNGMAKPKIGCRLLNKSLDDETSQCLFRFWRTNSERRHLAQIFVSVDVFGLAVM